jgi:hypothetical protein
METIKKDEKRPGQRQVGSNLYVNKTRRNIMKTKILAIVAILAMALMAAPASATIFSAVSGDLAASANMTVSGDILTVVLTNTSAADVEDPADVLTAVFFSLPSNILTPSSALLTAGSTVFYDADGQPAGGVVGGEWEYLAGLVGAPNGATNGIGSAGFGLFGSPNFPGANLADPVALDGVQYGILSAGDNTNTGNGGITGSGGLIKNSVTFQLTGATGLDTSLITDVSFQYGTALDEPNIVVPLPPSVLLMGSGLLGLGLVGWRRRSHKA